jgi:hypothetical protein
MKHLLLRGFLDLGAWLIVSTAWTSIASAGSPAAVAGLGETSADGSVQSRELMKEGVAKFAQGDWEGAICAYQKAWELKPHPAIAANMAGAEMKLGRYYDAAAHLKYALGHLSLAQSDRRESMESQLNECRNHLVSLSLSVNIEGAEIFLDGRSVGQTPLSEEVLLEAGHHSIKVMHPGYDTQTQEIDVTAGQHIDLQFQLQPPPPAEPQKTASPVVLLAPQISPPAESQSNGRIWALIGGSAATVITLGIGIGYRIRANSLGGEVNSTGAQLDNLTATTSGQNCVSPTGNAQSLCSQLKSTLRQQDTAVNVSTGSFVAAGVLGVATVATYVLWPKKKSTPSQPKKVAFGVAPLSLGKAQGVQLYTTF